MNTHSFTFCGEILTARPTGTLWWPARRLLCVADLHLGKAERLARRGGAMLPPYELRDTLDRLHHEITTLEPDHIVALGDSFDDLAAAEALPDTARSDLTALASDRVWTWIAGNHDPDPVDLPGQQMTELSLEPLVFRHIAEPHGNGEISGHFHPKARLAGRRKPAFLIDGKRVVLPAFGTYTGGLDCTDPALGALMNADAIAVLTGRIALPVPLRTQKRPA